MTKLKHQLPVFARRLAQARERSGLSQKELGILAGLDPAVASPRINQYERGKHEPKLETAQALADALGIPPAFLYTEDELLARFLLKWNDLTLRQKKDLLKLAGVAKAPPVKRPSKKGE